MKVGFNFVIIDGIIYSSYDDLKNVFVAVVDKDKVIFNNGLVKFDNIVLFKEKIFKKFF